MPRPPNNDPAVLLERANKERERWRRSQETYLERPENAKAHKEVVNAYYQANKERLKEAANKRNAEKRKAEEDTKKTAAERKREEEERKMMEANDVNTPAPPAPKKKRGRKPKVVEIPKNEFVQEHKGLVNLLNEGSKDGQNVKRKLKKEAEKQSAELTNTIAQAPAEAAPKQKRKYVKSGKYKKNKD